MNKKWIVVIVLALVLAGLLVVAFRLDQGGSISNDAPTAEATTEPPTTEQPTTEQPTTAATEQTEETTFPTLEDSIFDGVDGPTQGPAQEPTQKEDKEPTTGATEPTQKPTDPTEKPSGGNTDSGKLTYDEYQNKTPEEQREYMDSFEDIDGFFDWYNSAKEEYDAQNPDIEVGDGNIDLGEIIGGNGG